MRIKGLPLHVLYLRDATLFSVFLLPNVIVDFWLLSNQELKKGKYSKSLSSDQKRTTSWLVNLKDS